MKRFRFIIEYIAVHTTEIIAKQQLYAQRSGDFCGFRDSYLFTVRAALSLIKFAISFSFCYSSMS